MDKKVVKMVKLPLYKTQTWPFYALSTLLQALLTDTIFKESALSVCVGCVCPHFMRFFSRPLIGPQIT